MQQFMKYSKDGNGDWVPQADLPLGFEYISNTVENIVADLNSRQHETSYERIKELSVAYFFIATSILGLGDAILPIAYPGSAGTTDDQKANILAVVLAVCGFIAPVCFRKCELAAMKAAKVVHQQVARGASRVGGQQLELGRQMHDVASSRQEQTFVLTSDQLHQLAAYDQQSAQWLLKAFVVFSICQFSMVPDAFKSATAWPDYCEAVTACLLGAASLDAAFDGPVCNLFMLAFLGQCALAINRAVSTDWSNQNAVDTVHSAIVLISPLILLFAIAVLMHKGFDKGKRNNFIFQLWLPVCSAKACGLSREDDVDLTAPLIGNGETHSMQGPSDAFNQSASGSAACEHTPLSEASLPKQEAEAFLGTGAASAGMGLGSKVPTVENDIMPHEQTRVADQSFYGTASDGSAEDGDETTKPYYLAKAPAATTTAFFPAPAQNTPASAGGDDAQTRDDSNRAGGGVAVL